MNLLKLILAGTLATNSLAASADDVARLKCQSKLSAASGTSDQIREEPEARRLRLSYARALRDLRNHLPKLFPGIKDEDYYQVLERLLGASLVKDGGMVLTAIIGPASMGKSTLANAIWALASEDPTFLPEHQVSRAGRKAGLTVRPLIFVAKGDSPAKALVLRGLRARYGELETYKDPDDPTKPGPPLLVELDRLNDFPTQPFVDTPDMTTGNPQTDQGPVYRGVTRDALLPAEVLLIMLNDENLRDFPLREMLIENFRKFGMRKAIFVLHTDAETDEDFADSREWLLETIRAIYGFKPNQRRQLEEAVLGMYAMPKERAVRLGRAHPKLIPFAGSDHFATLMTDIAKNGGEIRAFAGKKAAELVYDRIGTQVDSKDIELRVKMIYAKAIEGVLNIGPSAIDFPYEQARDQWRAMFSAQTPAATHVLDRTANFAAKAFKWMPNMSAPEAPLKDVLKSFDDTLKAAWLNRLNAILTDLRNDQVRLPQAPADELMQMIKEFNSLHRDHEVRDPVIVDSVSGLRTITLPSSKLLAPQNLKQLSEVAKRKAEDVLRRMAETPEDKPVQLVNVDDITEGLRSVLNEKYDAGARVRDVGADTVSVGISVGGPLTAAFKVGLFMIASTTTAGAAGVACLGAAVGSAGAAYLRKWREGRTDVDLKPKLDEWYKAKQVDEFKKRVGTYLLQGLHQQLSTGVSGPETVALGRVRRALDTLLSRSQEEIVTDPAGVRFSGSNAGDRTRTR